MYYFCFDQSSYKFEIHELIPINFLCVSRKKTIFYYLNLKEVEFKLQIILKSIYNEVPKDGDSVLCIMMQNTINCFLMENLNNVLELT